MAFYTYIHGLKQTQLSWVWDLLVITNSTQISCEISEPKSEPESEIC